MYVYSLYILGMYVPCIYILCIYINAVIRDKDSLWKKSDQLSHERKLRASFHWMDSSEVTHCLDCKTEFLVTVRKVYISHLILPVMLLSTIFLIVVNYLETLVQLMTLMMHLSHK